MGITNTIKRENKMRNKKLFDNDVFTEDETKEIDERS